MSSKDVIKSSEELIVRFNEQGHKNKESIRDMQASADSMERDLTKLGREVPKAVGRSYVELSKKVAIVALKFVLVVVAIFLGFEIFKRVSLWWTMHGRNVIATPKSPIYVAPEMQPLLNKNGIPFSTFDSLNNI